MTAPAESQPATTPATGAGEREPGELSMRILEFALVLGALATVLLLGLPR